MRKEIEEIERYTQLLEQRKKEREERLKIEI